MFRFLPYVLRLVAASCGRIAVWSGRCRQRRRLIALSDRALHDIGIGRSEAWAEYRKPFWRG